MTLLATAPAQQPGLPADWEPQALIAPGQPAAAGRTRERRSVAEFMRA